jgi:hypothetical protein
MDDESRITTRKLKPISKAQRWQQSVSISGLAVSRSAVVRYVSFASFAALGDLCTDVSIPSRLLLFAKIAKDRKARKEANSFSGILIRNTL